MQSKSSKFIKLKELLIFPVISITLFGCSKNSETDANVKFWSLDTNNKVVQDRGFDYYASDATDPSLTYKMAQGEYESAQIIMTPDANISSYDVTFSDIVDDQGNKINPENIHVFAQRYIKVSSVFDTATNQTPGMFPDPLIPFEASKKYGENSINKDMNQAVYVSIETDLNQIPGIYKGTVSLTLDGKTYDFPVVVDVVNAQVSETTHANSIFINSWNYQFQEMQGGQEALDKYTNACIDYRLGTDKIVVSHNDPETYIDYYVEKAYQYMQNPRYPTITIPYKEVYNAALGHTVFDVDIMKNYIRAYFNKSIETGFNMFKKSRFYITTIDEPEEVGIIPQAQVLMNLYNQTITEIADELSLIQTASPLQTELIESIRGLQNVVTNRYNDELEPYVDTWCPKIDEYNREYDRDKYETQKEKWWYTCVYPRAPYPTYHTEDTCTSAKLLSWMQAQYGVSGNLYWATNNYAYYTNSGFQPIEDPFANADYAANINGDGYLFYPGGQYGLSNPIPSNRIEAIRDGVEEYELLYSLKEKNDEIGGNYSNFVKFLTNPLYNGTRIHASSTAMREARNELLDICSANRNGSDFLVYDYQNNYDQNVIIKFYAKNGTTIKFNNANLTEGPVIGNGHIFTTFISLSSAKKVNIEITYNGKTTSFTHDFGGAITTKVGSQFVSGFKKQNASVSATVVQATDITTTVDHDLVKLDIGATSDARQSIKYEPAFLKEVNNSAFGLNLEIFNPTPNNIEFSVAGRFSKRSSDSYLVDNEMLKPGLNNIFISLNTLNWNNYGNLSYVLFVFGNNNSKTEDAKTMYFSRISIIAK